MSVIITDEDTVSSIREKIRVEILRLQTVLVFLQNNICKHPNVKETARSNTGNYDPGADVYWTEFDCPDCDKFWKVYHR
jgi:hypothetical protein